MYKVQTTPVAESRDEWARSFLELSTLIIQNLNTKAIADMLTAKHITYDANDGSLRLTERLISFQQQNNKPFRLTGLRAAQLIRSKVAAHDGGRQARKIADQAMLDHGTYKAHFEHICDQIAIELQQMQIAFDATQAPLSNQD